MGADLQLVVVGVVVLAAAAFVVRSAWRTWFGKASGCASGCGKCSAGDPPPVPGRVSLL